MSLKTSQYTSSRSERETDRQTENSETLFYKDCREREGGGGETQRETEQEQHEEGGARLSQSAELSSASGSNSRFSGLCLCGFVPHNC